MLLLPEFFHLVITGLFILVPTALIYKKAGFSPLWSALVFLPYLGLFLIFVQLAFLPWPNQKKTDRS